MHRHWTRRLGALLFGLWFVLAGFDSGAADACPMQGMSATSSAMPTSSTHSMPMGTDSDHGSDSGQQNSQHSQHSQHSHHGSCCSCCSTSALDVPVRQNYVARVAEQTITPVAGASEASEAWVDFILPFPTAPPAGQLA